MTEAVFQQHQIAQSVLGHISSRIAAALVILPSSPNHLDQSLGLLFALHSLILPTHNEQSLIILEHAVDMIFTDVVIGIRLTTVADQNRTSDFLIQHHPHFLLHPGHHVEISNINDVVAIQLLLLVNGLRIGCPLQQSEHFILLLPTLDVTPGPRFVLGNIRKQSLNAGERSMINSVHDVGYPTHIALNKSGAAAMHIPIFREQPIDLINAVFGAVLQHRLAQASQPLGILNQGFHLRMGQSIPLILLHSIVIKHILFHSKFLSFNIAVSRFIGFFVFIIGFLNTFKRLSHQIFSHLTLFFRHGIKNVLNCFTVSIFAISISVTYFFVFVFVFIVATDRFADQIFNNLTLFFIHRIENILDSFIIIILGFLFCRFFLLWLFFGFGVNYRLFRIGFSFSMTYDLLGLFFLLKFHTGFEFKTIDVIMPNSRFSLTLFAMSQHRKFDFSSGICTSKNQTQFTNHAVNYITTTLNQLIGVNAQTIKVTMANTFSGMTPHVRIIKTTISINTIFPIFEQSMADYPSGIIMIMLVYQRNRSPVVVFEGVFPNGSAISAQKIVLRRPSAEVKLTFLHSSLPFLF